MSETTERESGFVEQILIMGLVVVAIYLASDWILRQVEQMRGSGFGGARPVVFFFIFFPLTLIAFQIAQRIWGA